MLSFSLKPQTPPLLDDSLIGTNNRKTHHVFIQRIIADYNGKANKNNPARSGLFLLPMIIFSDTP